MRCEMGHLARDWWCRGGGGAVLALLGVVATFRRPSDPIFWVAIAFFVGHTAVSVRRWLRERRARTSATVIRHHVRVAEPVFAPAPLLPIRITSKNLPQQTKKTA